MHFLAINLAKSCNKSCNIFRYMDYVLHYYKCILQEIARIIARFLD